MGVNLWGESPPYVNPVNAAAKPLYKIVRRFYKKNCGFTLLNRIPKGKFNRVNIYPPKEDLSAFGGFIIRLTCYAIATVKADGEGELKSPLYPIRPRYTPNS